jgi:hypothetical protein
MAANDKTQKEGDHLSNSTWYLDLPNSSQTKTSCDPHDSFVPSFDSQHDSMDDLFNIIRRTQENRIDDQRCKLDLQNVNTSEISEVIPLFLEQFWIEIPENNQTKCISQVSTNADDYLVNESSYLMYRKYFLHVEHFNFVGEDDRLNPLLLSMRFIKDKNNKTSQIFLILRLSDTFEYRQVDGDQSLELATPMELVKDGFPEFGITSLEAILFPFASEKIIKYDE